MHFEDQLYTVPVEGGFPTQVPLPIAEDATFSPDGTHLAYVPHPSGRTPGSVIMAARPRRSGLPI